MTEFWQQEAVQISRFGGGGQLGEFFYVSHRFYCTTVFLQGVTTVWEGEVECPQLVCKIQYLEIFTNGHSFFN